MRSCVLAVALLVWPCTCHCQQAATSEAQSKGERLVVLYNGAVHVIRADAVRPTASAVGTVSAKSNWVSVASSGRVLTVDPYEEVGTPAGWKTRGMELRALAPRPNGRLSCADLSPDGQDVCLVEWLGDEHRHVLYLESLGRGVIEAVGRKWHDLLAPAWSPDSQLVAFFASADEDPRRFRLCVYDCDTRTESEAAPPSGVASYGSDYRPPPVWAANSKRLFFRAAYTRDYDIGTYTVSWPVLGAPVLVCRDDVSSIYGEHVFGMDKSGVCKWDLSCDPPKKIAVRQRQEGDALMVPLVSPSGRFLAFKSLRSGLMILDLSKDTIVYENKTWVSGPSADEAVYAWVPVAPAPESTLPTEAKK